MSAVNCVQILLLLTGTLWAIQPDFSLLGSANGETVKRLDTLLIHTHVWFTVATYALACYLPVGAQIGLMDISRFKEATLP